MLRNEIINEQERTWHQGFQCHQIQEKDVERFLGNKFQYFITTNLFGQMFKRGPVIQIIDESDPK